MKKITTFLLSIFCITFVSCVSENKEILQKDLNSEANKVLTEAKKNFYSDATTRAFQELPTDPPPCIDRQQAQEIEQTVSNNVTIASNNDIFFLFDQYGLNHDIIYAMYDYYGGEDYFSILDKYHFSGKNLEIFANATVHLDYILENSGGTNTGEPSTEGPRKANAKRIADCVVAVVGVVSTVIEATHIGGVWSLGAWILNKAIRYYGVAGCALGLK